MVGVVGSNPIAPTSASFRSVVARERDGIFAGDFQRISSRRRGERRVYGSVGMDRDGCGLTARMPKALHGSCQLYAGAAGAAGAVGGAIQDA